MQFTLLKIGTCGHILSKVRESLIDKNRIMTFAQQSTNEWLSLDRAGLGTPTARPMTNATKTERESVVCPAYPSLGEPQVLKIHGHK